jgi:hypothetical protein
MHFLPHLATIKNGSTRSVCPVFDRWNLQQNLHANRVVYFFTVPYHSTYCTVHKLIQTCTKLRDKEHFIKF